jgi:hypothetical protein
MNPNYVIAIKQDIDKLLVIGFIQLHVEETTYISPIKVVPKKNEKFKICVNFKKLNATTKKNPCLLPFIDDVLNVIEGHDTYSFLNGYFGCH